MSYTYLLELGGESSAECFLDIPACALSNGINTQGNAFLPVKGTDACHDSQSGTMCKPLTEIHGEDTSTSCAVDSLVRTSQQQEVQIEKAWLENEADCGLKWQESAGKYDPDSSSWKTHQLSLFGGLELCSETWPKWGTMRSGEWYPLEMLAHDTSVRECGLLPTIGTPIKTQRCRSEDFMSPAKNPFELCPKGFLPHPEWVERLMGWPDGWTDLNALEMAKFHKWLRLHSSCFHRSTDKEIKSNTP
jgi:hypothetical protein